MGRPVCVRWRERSVGPVGLSCRRATGATTTTVWLLSVAEFLARRIASDARVRETRCVARNPPRRALALSLSLALSVPAHATLSWGWREANLTMTTSDGQMLQNVRTFVVSRKSSLTWIPGARSSKRDRTCQQCKRTTNLKKKNKNKLYL